MMWRSKSQKGPEQRKQMENPAKMPHLHSLWEGQQLRLVQHIQETSQLKSRLYTQCSFYETYKTIFSKRKTGLPVVICRTKSSSSPQ